jgi:hypothetical protein
MIALAMFVVQMLGQSVFAQVRCSCRRFDQMQ